MQIIVDDQITDLNLTFDNHRGLQFGDGFFTTGVIEDGRLLHQPLHLERLEQSASHFKIATFDINQLSQKLSQVTQKYIQATIRITVVRTQNMRGYAIDPTHSCKVFILLSPWSSVPSVNCELFFAESEISQNKSLAGYKHLNRLDSVLAASEAVKANQEAIFCIGNEVICGAKSNLFMFDGFHWITPPIDKAGVKGITRKRIFKLMKKNQVPFQVASINKEQLMNAKSAFIANSLVGIWPVAQVEDKALDINLCLHLQSNISFSR